MERVLADKTMVVTGATSGIGLATAQALAAMGADVIGVGRSESRGRDAEALLRNIRPGGRFEYVTGDLSLQRDVRKIAATIRGKLAGRGIKGLDGLVNNAGTFTYWFTLTEEGFEMQWAVNHLAPFLLTRELLPLLQTAPHARVVTVSSESHFNTRLRWDDIQLRRNYNSLLAYQQTKLANVMFTAELNRRLGPNSTVRGFAVDPGLVNTEIGYKGNPGIVGWVWSKRAAAGITAEESGRDVAYLLAEPSLQDARNVYWKERAPKQPSREALDTGSALRLWAMSEKMCGL